MKTIDLDTLATVTGGMRWQDFRPSENVEDRRAWTPQQNRNAPIRNLPPPSPGPRTPGDMPAQGGLDDVMKNFGNGR